MTPEQLNEIAAREYPQSEISHIERAACIKGMEVRESEIEELKKHIAYSEKVAHKTSVDNAKLIGQISELKKGLEKTEEVAVKFAGWSYGLSRIVNNESFTYWYNNIYSLPTGAK